MFIVLIQDSTHSVSSYQYQISYLAWKNILGYEPKNYHLIWLQLDFKQPQSGAVPKEQCVFWLTAKGLSGHNYKYSLIVMEQAWSQV